MPRGSTVRIGNGQGFWGDSSSAPLQLIERGGIDYLTLDYLAEVTMSILQKQKGRNPDSGYATDFISLMEEVLPAIASRGIRVVANASGVNSQACLARLRETAGRRGASGMRVAVIEGDDLLPRMEELIRRGWTFSHLDTQEPLGERVSSVTAANAYIGSFPIADAINLGGQIVLGGRITDPGLVVGPLIHEFGWSSTDYDPLAAATVAGHIVECGAQATGGNFSRWWEIPDLAGIGYPIVEASADGTFVITKPEGTGGAVTIPTVTEQILYELGDPRNYVSPDVIADFTSFSLKDLGADRVAVRGTRGRAPTDFYKVSIGYRAGFRGTGELTVAGPRAVEKARTVAEIIFERLERSGIRFDETRSEIVGTGVCAFSGAPEADLPEVLLRLTVRDSNEQKVASFGRELAPVITNGPPGVTGFAGGRPKPQEVIAYWPTLIPKQWVPCTVRVEDL